MHVVNANLVYYELHKLTTLHYHQYIIQTRSYKLYIITLPTECLAQITIIILNQYICKILSNQYKVIRGGELC